MNWMRNYISWLLLAVVLTACGGAPEYPRKRGFHRLELPAHRYRTFTHAQCPFTFDYPEYGVLELQRVDSCFFNIRFDDFGCRWHITTRRFDGDKVTYDYTLEDYRQVIFKHAQKAAIYEQPLRLPNGRGTLFELYGESPTFADVYFSDTSHYALLVSCYFDTAVKNDSLAPVIAHLKKDLSRLVGSVRWGGR